MTTRKTRQLGGLHWVANWMDEDPFIDPFTGVGFGGCNGIRVASLIVLRLAYCARYIAEKQLSVDDGFFHSGTFRPYGNVVIEGILSTINSSVITLSPSVESRSLSGIPQIPFHALPARAEAAANSAIGDLAQSQEAIHADQLDIPSPASRAETLEVEDSIDPMSDQDEPSAPLGPTPAQPQPPSDPVESEEERASIPSNSDDSPRKGEQPPLKKAKTSGAKANVPDPEEPVVKIKKEPAAAMKKGPTSMKAKPKIKAGPSDPETIFNRRTLDVDELMKDGQKGKGKANPKKMPAHETSAFETPAADDPLFRKINHVPVAGQSHRAASAAGSTKHVTYAASGK
ncbi:hypothetical protein RSAG8_07369, partial [Rhizoctonia solani AG-8 WAC10335]